MLLPVFLQNFLFSVEGIKISGIAKRTDVCYNQCIMKKGHF